jgi:putative FmdB family regulatory protein
MPTYSHRCTDCGHFDDFVRYSLSVFEENEVMECPECKNKTWKREIGSPAFDIVGYCYDNEYGKKNWKARLSTEQQAQVLAGERTPY